MGSIKSILLARISLRSVGRVSEKFESSEIRLKNTLLGFSGSFLRKVSTVMRNMIESPTS